MCRTYHGEQRMFQVFCAQYHLTAFPASEHMLMVFVTYLDDHLHRHYATIHHYMVNICMVHIALGLSSPLEYCPCLHQLLWAICQWQPPPQLNSGWLGMTTEFLCQSRPLHQLHNPKESMLWEALTIGHYDLFWSVSCSTQASRGWGSPVHKSVGCCPSLQAGPPTLCEC